MSLRLFSKIDIPDRCSHCRKELDGRLKCLYCDKLVDENVVNFKEISKDRIYGGIYCYAFSSDKSKITFITASAGSKNPAFYLYDIKSQKIIWAKKKEYAVDRIFYLEDRIVIISRTFGISNLESFNVSNGELISKIDKKETWTNMINFKDDLLMGFRGTYLYRYDKNLKIVKKIYNSAPFNIVTNETEDYVAFSSGTILFLLDSDLNLLWKTPLWKKIMEDDSPEEYEECMNEEREIIDLADTYISGINFWQLEESGEIYIECKMQRGTDQFVNIDGEIISDKIKTGITKSHKEQTEKEKEDNPLELRWTLREGGFWFKPMGVKLYRNIKEAYFRQYDQITALKFLEELDSTIDKWYDFISEKLFHIRKTTKFQELKISVLKRDKNRCVMCGNKKETYLHNIFSLSEHIAKHLLDTCSTINSIDVIKISSFYAEENNLILCSKCYLEEYEDKQIQVHFMFLGKGSSVLPYKKKEYFKLADIENKVYGKLHINFASKDWFLAQLDEIERLEIDIAESYHGRLISGRRNVLKIKIFLRIGDYALAKRWALRQERYLKKAFGDTNPNKGDFIDNNWEIIISRIIDKIIKLHKEGNYKYSRSYDGYDGIYPRYRIQKYRKLFSEAEKEIKTEMSILNE